MTIACLPLYTLQRHDRPLPLGDVLDRLDEHVDGNDHFEFFLWPYTRTALTRSTMRSDAAPEPQVQWKRTLQEQVIENQVLKLSCGTGRRFERLAAAAGTG